MKLKRTWIYQRESCLDIHEQVLRDDSGTGVAREWAQRFRLRQILLIFLSRLLFQKIIKRNTHAEKIK